MRASTTRGRRGARTALPALLAFTLLALSACAYRAPVHTPPPPAASEETARALVAEWQQRVAAQVALHGADPAALARLPALRSPAVLRPGQIVFVASDVDAQFAERDGYDVCGLLVGRADAAGAPWYVFIVGAVQRREYRATGVTDLRVVALRARGGDVAWATGPSDAAAFARYRATTDTTLTVQFPAEADRFRLVACDPAVCVEETVSGARWAVVLPSTP